MLVQFAGPCRLGYYDELKDSILRDLGYEFDMLNFATVTGKPLKEYIEVCKRKINPNVSVPHSVVNMLATFKMAECLDEANDYYLANAAFEDNPGDFEHARQAYFADMRNAACEKDIVAAQKAGLERFRAIPCHKPDNPVRVGLVGEYFTAVDESSNLGVEKKLLGMGVELHRMLNMTNRNLRYNEKKPASKRLGLHHVRHGTDVKHDHCRHAEVRASGLRRRHPYEILRLHARDRLHARAAAH